MAHITPRQLLNLAEYDHLWLMLYQLEDTHRWYAHHLNSQFSDPSQLELARTRYDAARNELSDYVYEMTTGEARQAILARVVRAREANR